MAANQMLEPSSFFTESFDLADLVKDLNTSLLKSVAIKLKDSNSMKSNINNPHRRLVSVPDVHKYVFSGCFRSKLERHSEISLAVDVDFTKSSPIYSLNSLRSLSCVFDVKNLIKFHRSGDISIITPWCTYEPGNDEICTNATGEVLDFIYKKAYVIPLYTSQDVVTCLLPCAGLDPDTGDTPDWAWDIDITAVLPGISLKDFPVLKKRGDGKVSVVKGTDYVSVKSGQFDEGDYIVCRGDEWRRVMAIAEDAFFAEGARNVIRCTVDFSRNSKTKHLIL